MVEDIIIKELEKSKKNFSSLTEESGFIEKKDKENYWIIDPIDGTTNFLNGVPHFCISIALLVDNEIIAGAAIDVYESEPATDNVMFGAKNLLLTPHLGASSKEAQSNVAIDVANQVADFLKDNKIVNNVNSF